MTAPEAVPEPGVETTKRITMGSQVVAVEVASLTRRRAGSTTLVVAQRELLKETVTQLPAVPVAAETALIRMVRDSPGPRSPSAHITPPAVAEPCGLEERGLMFSEESWLTTTFWSRPAVRLVTRYCGVLARRGRPRGA